MEIENVKPEDIERKSFEIITEELAKTGVVINGSIPVDKKCQKGRFFLTLSVIKRCIHTTADFDYAKTMYFSEGATERLAELIRKGATIVTDTNMALAGINKRELAKHRCDIRCFMADDEVAKEAKERGLTRAHVSMERAMRIAGPVIFVVGNAPTALITLREYHDRGSYDPAFIVGVPVGFVNVVSAKELITGSDIPHIVNSGRKGGSNVAAAIVNAILYNME